MVSVRPSAEGEEEPCPAGASPPVPGCAQPRWTLRARPRRRLKVALPPLAAGYRPLCWGGGGGWGTASMSGGPLEAEGTRAPLSPPRLGALTGCWAPPASPRGAPGSRSGRAEGSAA